MAKPEILHVPYSAWCWKVMGYTRKLSEGVVDVIPAHLLISGRTTLRHSSSTDGRPKFVIEC